MYLLICVLFDKKTVVPHLIFFSICNHVMVSILTSSVVDPGFEPQSGQTKDYKIGILH